MTLAFAAIAPHGGIAIPEAVAPDALARATADGFAELGRRFEGSGAVAAIVFTPHGVHVEGHLGVAIAGRIAGALEGAREPVRLDLPGDPPLAAACLQALTAAGLPALGLSYGGNDAASAVMPMDWAVLIPLWYLGGRGAAPPSVVAVSPARDLDPALQMDAGRAIREAVDSDPRPIAVVASADHGHAHSADGPYGFDPAAAEYDRLVVDAVREGDLGRLRELDRAFVEAARADSWWQLLMLHGVLGGAAAADLLSYEAPTYFGMLCAELAIS